MTFKGSCLCWCPWPQGRLAAESQAREAAWSPRAACHAWLPAAPKTGQLGQRPWRPAARLPLANLPWCGCPPLGQLRSSFSRSDVNLLSRLATPSASADPLPPWPGLLSAGCHLGFRPQDAAWASARRPRLRLPGQPPLSNRDYRGYDVQSLPTGARKFRSTYCAEVIKMITSWVPWTARTPNQSILNLGNQPWIFIGRTDAEGETPIIWPPDGKNWLTPW